MDDAHNANNPQQAQPEPPLPQSQGDSPQASLPSPPSPQLQVIRDEDFTPLYANNVRFEASVWDLKLLFGELDQSIQSNHPETVIIHTGMTIPWSTAKLGHYYLGMQIAMHELENGKIKINSRVLPPMPQPPAGEYADSEIAHAAYQLALKMREEFISKL